jgi:hypothetical protein
MKAAVEGCRRLNTLASFYIDLSRVLKDSQAREYYQDRVEILTPICKAYSTDMAFRVAETAVQCMGGSGYIKDYPVEQYLRDLKVACIFEGTNGIQAIDLQGRKLTMKGGRPFRDLVREIDNFIHQSGQHPTLGPLIGNLQRAKEIMVTAAESFPGKREEDPGLPLSVAKPFMDLTGHVLCTWLLLKSAVIADSLLQAPQVSESDRAFYRGKIYTAHFAVANFLPQAEALAKTIASWDRSIIDMDERSF